MTIQMLINNINRGLSSVNGTLINKDFVRCVWFNALMVEGYFHKDTLKKIK